MCTPQDPRSIRTRIKRLGKTSSIAGERVKEALGLRPDYAICNPGDERQSVLHAEIKVGMVS
jgi:hypothetical protein